MVNKLPSINLPLTGDQGLIHPVWYEFLRAFIASVDNNSGGSTADNTVIAGAGILGAGSVSTVNVGQGDGILIGADTVSVDITHQVNVQAALEDEVLIAKATDGGRIKKTSLRDVSALSVASPGGLNTSMQYNSNGIFGGDNNFITDGSGAVTITGSLTVDNLTVNGNVISSDSNTTPIRFEVPAGGLNQMMFTQSGAGNSAYTAEFRGLGSSANIIIRSDNNAGSNLSDSFLSFATNASTPEWSMGLKDSQDDDFVLTNGAALNSTAIFTIDRGDDYFAHNSNLLRKTTAGITASTTQTQGQGALTADVNQISVCANANDTVTLPGAQAGSIIYIINSGAQTLQIFPASGDDLGAGVNTATTLAAAGKALFVAYDSVNWKQFI